MGLPLPRPPLCLRPLKDRALLLARLQALALAERATGSRTAAPTLSGLHHSEMACSEVRYPSPPSSFSSSSSSSSKAVPTLTMVDRFRCTPQLLLLLAEEEEEEE